MVFLSPIKYVQLKENTKAQHAKRIYSTPNADDYFYANKIYTFLTQKSFTSIYISFTKRNTYIYRLKCVIIHQTFVCHASYFEFKSSNDKFEPLKLFFVLISPCRPNFIFFFQNFSTHASLPISFKIVQNVSYPRERIKTSGYIFEFKSNLNSNANQPILIHSCCEKRRVWAPLCVESLHEKLFLV